VSDSNAGGPPQNPYGQTPDGETPYGGQPSPPTNPYGAQPPPPANPYAAQPPPPANPYAAQPPPPANPYGQVPFAQQPTGQLPYGETPIGDGLDMYGRPLHPVDSPRPGTVTAAGWITLIVAGLSAVLYGFLTLAMIVAKDDVLREIDKALAEQGSTGDFDAESAFGVVVGVLVVVIIWCLIACVLAVFVLRRSNAARIALVVSAVVAGLLSLLGIGSAVSAIPLLACLATVILLFTGGAGEWFARRPRY
jgi:hypothetical protein